MKIRLLLTAFIGCLLFTSCEKDSTQTELESFETTFQKKGLSDPFAFNYTIITTLGKSANLTTLKVKDFISGKLLNSDEIIEFTDYQLLQNPDDETEYAITAIAVDGNMKVNVQMFQTEMGFELTGKKCTCKSSCSYGCDASIWGGQCQCSSCSDRKECKKESSIEIPDPSIIAAP